MSTVVFMSRHRSPEGEEVGRAVLTDGRVRFSGAMAPGGEIRERVRFDETAVRVMPDGRELTPADGERYLQALPMTFHGSHFWAAIAD